ncbi:MAG TPA: UDP-2,3-diacylglucosamine diphosphatase [Bacteroidota bacterium]
MNKSRRKSKRPAFLKTYFFSDAHLGIGSSGEDRAKELRIIRFLDFVKQDAEQVVIVGDLFDYWFEYRTVVPKGYVRLLAKLAELTDKGIGVTFVAGNHDFWLGNYFPDELGIQVFIDPIERIIGGKRFYIHHGDGLIKDDLGYRILKRILRNKFSIWFYSLIHPDLAGRIARWSSGTSRHYTGGRKYEEADMVEFAGEKIREGFDFVVMGHHHQSAFKKLGKGVYVNLGDWIRENTYAVFNGSSIALKSWSQ